MPRSGRFFLVMILPISLVSASTVSGETVPSGGKASMRARYSSMAFVYASATSVCRSTALPPREAAWPLRCRKRSDIRRCEARTFSPTLLRRASSAVGTPPAWSLPTARAITAWDSCSSRRSSFPRSSAIELPTAGPHTNKNAIRNGINAFFTTSPPTIHRQKKPTGRQVGSK